MSQLNKPVFGFWKRCKILKCVHIDNRVWKEVLRGILLFFFKSIEFVTTLLLFYILIFHLWGMWDLSPLCVCVLRCFSRIWLCVTLRTIARQAPLSMGFSRQESWSGLPCLLQGVFPTQGSNSYTSCIDRWVLYYWCHLGNPLDPLAPWLGIEPSLPALEGEVLAIGLPGNSVLSQRIIVESERHTSQVEGEQQILGEHMLLFVLTVSEFSNHPGWNLIPEVFPSNNILHLLILKVIYSC